MLITTQNYCENLPVKATEPMSSRLTVPTSNLKVPNMNVPGGVNSFALPGAYCSSNVHHGGINPLSSGSISLQNGRMGHSSSERERHRSKGSINTVIENNGNSCLINNQTQYSNQHSDPQSRTHKNNKNYPPDKPQNENKTLNLLQANIQKIMSQDKLNFQKQNQNYNEFKIINNSKLGQYSSSREGRSERTSKENLIDIFISPYAISKKSYLDSKLKSVSISSSLSKAQETICRRIVKKETIKGKIEVINEKVSSGSRFNIILSLPVIFSQKEMIELQKIGGEKQSANGYGSFVRCLQKFYWSFFFDKFIFLFFFNLFPLSNLPTNPLKTTHISHLPIPLTNKNKSPQNRNITISVVTRHKNCQIFNI